MVSKKNLQKTLSILTATALALLIFIGFGLTTASGHGNATGMVKERMDFMKAMGDASITIVEMLKGKIGYDSAKLADQAKLINDHSKELLHYFPEGSHQKPSEALPAIWQNWDDFKQRNQALETESAKLLEVAEQEDKKAISKQFAAVGKTCTGCHQDYRQKKKK